MNRWEDVPTLEAARRAVWSEDGTDYGARAELCLDLVETRLDLKPGDGVLDLGCGIGRLAVPLARRRPDCFVLGYDTSKAMLSFAVDAALGVPNVVWLSRGPLPACDAAYSVVTFQHLAPEVVARYLRELGEALTTGGTCVFQFVRGDHHADDDHRYRLDELRAWCTAAYLKVSTVEHGLLYEEWTWITVRREQR